MAKKVVIKISGDAKEYKSTISTVNKENKKMGVSTAAMAGVATVAMAAIVAGVVAVTNAYAIQEQAEIRTRQTLKATGHAAGLTADELFNMASSLQEVTTFGDEVILSGQNMLLTFKNIGEDTFPRATKAMLDMSTAMGTDLKNTAIQLGKALNDPIVGLASLSRVGITFTKQQKDQIKALQQNGEMAKAQAIILKELESQFGGTAEAAGKGTGLFEQLGNTWGDIAEKLGKKLLPVTSYWARQVKKLGEELNKTFEDKPKKVENVGKALKEMRAELEKNIEANKRAKLFTPQLPTKFLKDRITLLELDLIAQVAMEKKAADKKAAIKKAARDKELAAKQESIAQSIAASQAEFDAEEELMKVEAGEISLEQLQNQVEQERVIKEDARIADLETQGKHDEAMTLQKETALKRRLAVSQKADALAKRQQQGFFSVAISLANSENKTLAAIGKAAALTQLAIKTPEAVGNSYAFGTKYGGPIGGAVLAGIASVAMAAQAAKIVGAYAEGGVIGGFSGATAGGDNRVATVRDGEMILNAGDQKGLFDFIKSTGASDEGGSESIDINLSMSGDIVDFIEAEVIRRRAIGTSRI